MKRLLLTCIFLLFGVTLLGQSTQTLQFDYPDVDLPQVISFEVKIDGGLYTSIGVPTGSILPDTLPNHKSFQSILPPLGKGDHTVIVRACSSLECSDDSSPLVFKLIGPPVNLRIKK